MRLIAHVAHSRIVVPALIEAGMECANGVLAFLLIVS